MTPANRETAVTGGHGFALDLSDWHYALTPACKDLDALCPRNPHLEPARADPAPLP